MLKQLIQRLLDSRTTPEEAGHSAMPSPTEVSLTPSVTSQEVWGDVCTGIASSDGYIRMDFGATSPEAIGSARSFGAVAFSTPQKTGDIVSVICPVAKGRAYAMSVRNANNITCAFVKLIGSIGGGQALKNALLQGGVLCRLKHLCNSLRRSSWLVRRRVFRTGRTPTSQIILPFSFHLQKTVLFIHPQATDGCRCTLGTRGLLTSQLILTQRIIAQSCPAFCLPLSVGTATFIEYVKALMSRSQLQLLYRKDGLCFFRLINSAVGGASC